MYKLAWRVDSTGPLLRTEIPSLLVCFLRNLHMSLCSHFPIYTKDRFKSLRIVWLCLPFDTAFVFSSYYVESLGFQAFLYLKTSLVSCVCGGSFAICFAFCNHAIISYPPASPSLLDFSHLSVINTWFAYTEGPTDSACSAKILISIHLSVHPSTPTLCLLFLTQPPLLLFLLLSQSTQPMTSTQPTWHSLHVFPSGSKREVSFGRFWKHCNTAWCGFHWDFWN